MWNIDETGFVIGVGGDQRIITTDLHNTLVAPSTTNRKSVTATETSNDVGNYMSQFIIFMGKQHKASPFANDLPDTTKLVANEDSHSTNDPISLQWLKQFEVHTAHKGQG